MFLGTNSDQKLSLKIDDHIIKQCQQVKLLGVTIDSRLRFDKYILELCCKVNKKVSALFRIRNYLDNNQANILCETTVLANLNYNRTHKRALWVLHKDNNLTFDKCLMKEAGITIHEKNFIS